MKTPQEVLQRVRWIQTLTLIWMSVEAVVSLGAAWMARSPALLAFGGDSGVELLSAAVVFWRFSAPSHREHLEERAGRITGGLLFFLAAFVVITRVLTLLGHGEAPAQPYWDSPARACRNDHALACSTETAALKYDCQRSVEGRCCRVGSLWLSSVDCFDGFGRQCGLESQLGRPHCRASIVAADCARGMGSKEG